MRYHDFITEGVEDPHIFKAVFLIGGPGSGKSTVRKQLFGGTGLRPIDIDEVYEYLRYSDGISGGYTDFLYKSAGAKIKKKMDVYEGGRLGLVIDSTGRNLDRITKTKARLDRFGYDTIAIYVKTDIDVALDRNEARLRMVKAEPGENLNFKGEVSTVGDLPQSNNVIYDTYHVGSKIYIWDGSQWVADRLPMSFVARNMHNEVTANLPALKALFGNDFITIANSNDKELQSSTNANETKITQFLNKPPRGQNVQAWIQAQRKRKAPEAVSEDLDDTLKSAREFVEQIMEKCKPYLSEINGDLGNYPLYRGTRRKHKPGTKLTHYSEPRAPVSTDLETHTLFDQIIQEAGKTANRSNAIFTSGSLAVAKRYGDTDLVFPIGDFYYTWSTEVADWYVITQRELADLEDSIKGDDNSLKQAIKSKHEIMIHCPNGYYVYPHTDLQYLEQYLNHFLRG